MNCFCPMETLPDTCDEGAHSQVFGCHTEATHGREIFHCFVEGSKHVCRCKQKLNDSISQANVSSEGFSLIIMKSLKTAVLPTCFAGLLVAFGCFYIC